MSERTYRLSTWGGDEQPNGWDPPHYVGLKKWEIRPALKALYRDGWDVPSIFVECEQDFPDPDGWRNMSSAIMDGTVIEAMVNGDVCLIRWTSDRVCAGTVAHTPAVGHFGPGWEDAEVHLIVDDPEAWRPVRVYPAAAPPA